MAKILWLVTDLQRGGTPLRLVRSGAELRRRGVELTIGCLAMPGPLSAVLAEAGIDTFACGARHGFDVAAVAHLASHVRRLNPDLIHASLFHANVAARLVGRLDRGRPIVTSTATIEHRRRWHRWGEMLTGGASDLHVANSRAVAAHLCDELGFDPARVRVIPNGIDVERIDAARPAERASLGLSNSAPLVLWAGRMDPEKRVEVLLDACARPAAVKAGVQLVLAGDGPCRTPWESLADRVGLSSRARFIGWRDDLPSWMKAADLFALPSATEGSPNVVLEAMASECPVAAADIPACRELLDGGRLGTLVRDGHPTSWCHAIIGPFSGVSGRTAATSAARRMVLARHTLAASVESTCELYANLGVSVPAASRPG